MMRFDPGGNSRSCAGFTVIALLTVAACGSEGEQGPTPAAPQSANDEPTVGAPTALADIASPEKAPEPPPKLNVIALFVDSLRADHMKWSGYEHDVMPNVAKFAESAVNYTQFYSVSSFTAMTFGGFVGARYPGELERSGYFFSRYPEEVLTFPEVLQKSGVRTIAGHAHWYFNLEKAGFHQGFDDYQLIEGLKKSNTTDENVTSPKMLELAKAQLGNPQNVGGQFFAWYHLLDPHDQYVKHEGVPDFGRGMKARYDGELFFTDQHIGKLLEFIDAQPWADHTAVLISGDHGEAFGEHKMYRHGFELYEVLIRVPLLVRMPGGKARQVEHRRSGIDLPKTIMDLMGVEPDPSFRGKSLVPELRGEDGGPRPVVVDLPRTSDNDRRRAYIEDDTKLIAFGDDDGYKLFDLAKDPGEKKDLRYKDKELFQKMEKRYKDFSKGIKDVCPKIKKLKGRKPSRPC